MKLSDQFLYQLGQYEENSISKFFNDKPYSEDDIFKNIEEIVTMLPLYIRNIDNPSEHLQRLAVSSNSYAIGFIPNPTLEARMIAVKKEYLALNWIQDQTEELVLTALRSHPKSKKYIKIPLTDAIIAQIVLNSI